MESNIKYDVFISYRRNGGSERAELLKLILEKYGYDHSRIFMDTHSIESCNFKQKIKEAIFLSKDFILIITKGCFDSIKKEDYWIFEILEALSLGKRIIPIFFDGIEGVGSNKLPADLVALSEINGIIYHPQYADAFYLKLLSFLNPNNIDVKKESSKLSYYLFGTLCLVILSCAILLGFIYLHVDTPSKEDPSLGQEMEACSQKTMDPREVQVAMGNAERDKMYPKAYSVDEGKFHVTDIYNGQIIEMEFTNKVFRNIVNDIVSQGIIKGEIRQFKKRNSPPDSLVDYRDRWHLIYSDGEIETISQIDFQKCLRNYLKHNYSSNYKYLNNELH